MRLRKVEYQVDATNQVMTEATAEELVEDIRRRMEGLEQNEGKQVAVSLRYRTVYGEEASYVV